MNEWLTLFTAFSLGLLSSAHCVGMCGGIMGALSMAIPAGARQRRVQLLLSYNLGRIASYSLMGLLLGLLAGVLGHLGAAYWLRILAGLLMIAMGLYLANWWRGLTYLERLGRYVWVYIQPLGKSFLPVSSVPKAFLLGVVWGWLPCGLVYSALAYAMTQAHAGWSAAVMLAFGVGTLPSVLATGFAAAQLGKLLQQHKIRVGFALLVIAFGLWTVYAANGHHQHHRDRHNPTETQASPVLPTQSLPPHSHHLHDQ